MGNLLECIFGRRNISYSVFRGDGQWGTPDNNNNWSGMSGYVQRNEADIMLGPSLMSDKRANIMDFSTPLLFDYNSILSGDSNSNLPDLLQYFYFFDILIWSLIFVTLLNNDNDNTYK